jgi:hypothetical protein
MRRPGPDTTRVDPGRALQHPHRAPRPPRRRIVVVFAHLVGAEGRPAPRCDPGAPGRATAPQPEPARRTRRRTRPRHVAQMRGAGYPPSCSLSGPRRGAGLCRKLINAARSISAASTAVSWLGDTHPRYRNARIVRATAMVAMRGRAGRPSPKRPDPLDGSDELVMVCDATWCHERSRET